MEDFLKDRPVLDPKSALVLAAEVKPAAIHIKPPAATPAGAPPFEDLRRDPPGAKAVARPPAGAPAPAEIPAAAAQALKGEHGVKVQTIVERGMVTKIIVTCTCGKVTEIACQY